MKKFSDLSPFKVLISFQGVVRSLEQIQDGLTEFQAEYVRKLLAEIYKYPELIEGIEKIEDVRKYEGTIKMLLADLFPMLLTHNEIKAVTIPYHYEIMNLTQRFQQILKDAGPDYELSFTGLSEHNLFIKSCCVIIKQYFNYPLNISDSPLFLEIPDKNGIIHHYRVMINADFMEVIPTEKSKILTKEEIEELLDNYDNLELWKEKFPNESWILKGFAIVNLFDVTVDNAVSTLKGNLLSDVHERKIMEVEKIFKSIYKIPELKIGFTIFGNFLDRIDFKVIKQKYYSHFLAENASVEECQELFCDESIQKMIMEKEYFAVSDIDKLPILNPKMKKQIEHLKSQNVKSFIFVPLFKEDKLLGLLELSSPNKGELNSVNARRLEYILPYIKDKVSSSLNDLENEIEAIIQKEFTAIHPSVLWRFKEEALSYLTYKRSGLDYSLKDIVFPDVYPLYGQIDVQGSTVSRNIATQKDLLLQVEALIGLFELIFKEEKLPLFEHKIYRLKQILEELKHAQSNDSEQNIQFYLENEIHPILLNFQQNTQNHKAKSEIQFYFEKTSTVDGLFYKARREFDESISLINKKLAALLDEKQQEAQTYFPHYYERFKTDGVEHNLYIGASISPDKEFNLYYLQNLRLWQMQVMCEMENYFQLFQPTLPMELNVSSLILVFATPISIRFRMDEKQFDIDGSYNVRYQIVKKRIDKAKIKGSEERITQRGKLTIVYQSPSEREEYLGYIQLLQYKGMLKDDVEELELEDLQGLSGLKALRVGIVYSNMDFNFDFGYFELHKKN